MLSLRDTHITRIELETLLDEKIQAMEQRLLKQFTDEVVTDNALLDRVLGLLNHIVSQLDLLGNGFAAPPATTVTPPSVGTTQPTSNPHPASTQRRH